VLLYSFVVFLQHIILFVFIADIDAFGCGYSVSLSRTCNVVSFLALRKLCWLGTFYKFIQISY